MEKGDPKEKEGKNKFGGFRKVRREGRNPRWKNSGFTS